MITRIFYLFAALALLTLACSISRPTKSTPVGNNLTPSPTTSSQTQTPAKPTPEPSSTSTPTQTVTPTITVTVTPVIDCPTAPKTRFTRVGERGRVTDTKGVLPTRLRRSAEVSNSNILKLLPDKTEFEIIGGPVCTVVKDTGQAFVFWQIRIDTDPFKGWIAEGDAAGYFIEPIP
jgi:hypothetical protein